MTAPSVSENNWIIDLRQEAAKSARLVGGKSANLSELFALGVSSPIGFVVTTDAYYHFLENGGILEKVRDLFARIDTADLKETNLLCGEIQRIILRNEVPHDLLDRIRIAYSELSGELGHSDSWVAVRSSAYAEDSANSSFAGQHESYLFVRGLRDVITSIRKCYSSAFSTRAVFYASHNHIEEFPEFGVIVQTMVLPKSSGIAFSLDPSTGNADVIVVESSWGVGEAISQGLVTPDYFILQKKPFGIIQSRAARKKCMIVRGRRKKAGSYATTTQVPKALIDKLSIDSSELLTLGRLVATLEEDFRKPIDVEWCIDKVTKKLFVLQVRPETVWSKST